MSDENQLLLCCMQKRKEWIQKLDFYQDEVIILQKELYKTIDAHPDLPSIFEHLNEYRTIIQKKLKQIDELKVEIILIEKDQSISAVDRHLKEKEKMNAFEQKVEEFKIQIRRFISKNMK